MTKYGWARLLLMMVLTLPVAVQAQFKYLIDNGTITITTGNCLGGAVAIPDMIDGLPVTNIEDYAFSDCTSLTSVTIGNSVTGIGDSAFSGCTSLTGITIPNSVTRIGENAFEGCTSLTSVTIPDRVTSIGDSAFYGFTSLSAITVEALNPVFSSVDGVMFNKSQTTLIQYPGGKAGSYTIPNSVISIRQGAFSGCTSLNSVTIGTSITSIEFETFSGCTSLTSVTIPNSLISIRGYAFYGCTSLTRVTIPDSVSIIGAFAFSGCTSLTAVYFKGNTPSLQQGGEDVFRSSDKAIVYYLPETTGWGSTFSRRPAVLWYPQVLSDANFGVRAGVFGFTITGPSGLVIVVEASADLANPVWSPVGTNTLTDGSSYFSDPQWTNYPSRSYRLRSP